MAAKPPRERVAAVRRFNRFYTRRIGVLLEGLLHSPYTLTEARLIFELAQRDGVTASALGQDLGLDAGYMSRLLRGLQHQGLIRRARSAADGRQFHLHLTAAGRDAFAMLDARSHDEFEAMLAELSEPGQARLVCAMETIEELLGQPAARPATIVLRPHQPGDMGWVVHRHGVLYAEEYGWDERFEALVAQIVADFVNGFDARRERCWIAERDGAIVGSVFLVRQSDEVAKLRLLLVEPRARGHGLGRRLVEECVRFARRTGYARITLWTNSVLEAARRLYEEAGFVLVDEAPHRSFGHDLVGQTWELPLR
jgi:DNA-binding MarR family transcriptional regulator/N-acetylglutamate synthase-like GNAT family acetyltransferase